MSSKSKSRAKTKQRPGRPLKPSAPPGAQRVDSVSDLARITGYGRESLRKARENGEILVASDGTMSVEQARAVMEERAERGQGGLGKSSEWREREIRAKALQREMRVQKEAGTLIEKSTVRVEWERSVTRVRQALLGLGRELSPRLMNKGPQEIQAIIDLKVYEILRSLAHGDYHPES